MSPPSIAVQRPPAQASAPTARRQSRLPLPPLRPPLSRTPRRERTGRPTRATVAGSLVLHLVLLLILALLPPRQLPGPAAPDAPAPGDVSAEYVSYMELGAWPAPGAAPAGLPAPLDAAPAAEVPTDAQQRPDSVRAAPAPVPAFPRTVPRGPAGEGVGDAGAPTVGGGTGAAAATGVPGGTPAGRGTGTRLGPEFGDRRLVVTPQAVPERELTDLERYLVQFHARLQALNDSLQGEADRERRLRDWTWRDSQGREWGIRDGKIIIDGKEIPIPLPTPYGDRDQENARRTQTRQREEIDRQADRIERDQYLRERSRVIRERGGAGRSGGSPE
jgi:hypothetical protein